MKTAIYGKGGIGKSTISANLSAALADQGCRVLQIGCDPKHDSTRLLLDGRRIVTALDYMKETPVAEQQAAHILHTGYKGIVCAEAGGPEPGVGCAGRGILSTFAMLDRLGVVLDDFDVVLYDVLGDVVCGGFAVPLRKGFADQVYVVSSEEFMSIYAANNILKGVGNFDEGGHRLAGLLLNSRGDSEDQQPVERFADHVGLPIVERIPRSPLFRQAEILEKTVVAAFPESAEAAVFQRLAAHVLNDKERFPARFVNEHFLEEQIFSPRGVDTFASPEPPSPPPLRAQPQRNSSREKLSDAPAAPSIPRYFSKSLLTREPLHGCAFAGALATLTQIKGAVVVAHGPESCSHIASQSIISAGIRLFNQKGLLLRQQLTPAIISSNMGETEVIYGGRESLLATLETAVAERPEAIFVITTCPSGVIGDNPQAAIEEIRQRCPDIPIVAVTTDGNLQGDYMQGVLNGCFEGAATLIDSAISPAPYRVNILAEKNIAFNAESNFQIISALLSELGIAVNCRFVRNTSVDELRNFANASLNLPAYTDYLGRVMTEFIGARVNIPTASLPFPVGFSESVRWLEEIAAFFGREAAAKQCIDRYRSTYRRQTATFREALGGRRLMLLSYIHNVDWLVEAALDLGMEIVKVGIFTFSQDNLFTTRYPGKFPVETNYDPAKRDDDIRTLKPDLLLGNYTPKTLPLPLHVDIIPMCPDVGFYGGLTFARRWATLLKAPVCEGWKNDGR